MPLTTTGKKYRLILSAVHMVYRLVNSTYNVKELCLRLTRLLCQFIHAHSASIVLLDAAKKDVIMVALFNNKINVLLDKKKDLNRINEKVKKVVKGLSIFERNFIGLPLIADDNIGALIIERKATETDFNEFDREMLSVFAEQAVTAIKNLQHYEEQQKTILGSIRCIGGLLKKQGSLASTHAPAYVKIVRRIAEQLNYSQEGIQTLEYACVLHDAGLMDIPFSILSKREALTSEEFKIIHQHPAQSVLFIKPVEFLKPVLPIILYHHERYDGTGYPAGLKKEQIPLGARIMAIVDAFEAMVQGRPYRKALTIEMALRELKIHSGTQFDPKVIAVMDDLLREKKFRKCLSLLKA